jgi:hypothetical protein
MNFAFIGSTNSCNLFPITLPTLSTARMLTPDRLAFSCGINGRRQLSRHGLRLRSPKVVKIRHTLLPLFRTQLRKGSLSIDGRRGLQRLRPPGIIFQAVIIIAGNDDLFVFVTRTDRGRYL